MQLAQDPQAKPAMDADRARQGLRELASAVRRSKTQLLLEVLPDVEAALAAGATRAEVLQRLQAAGLVMSQATFGSALARLRKQRRQGGAPSPTQSPPAPRAYPRSESVPPPLSPASLEVASPQTVQDFAALRARAHDLDALGRKHRERRRRERIATGGPAMPDALEWPERWKSKTPP